MMLNKLQIISIGYGELQPNFRLYSAFIHLG